LRTSAVRSRPAGGARRYPPNHPLRWERLERGWSYDDVARHLRDKLGESGDEQTGLDGNSVRRWEAGERWPEPRFRRHLVALYGRTASQLGLLTPEELQAQPVTVGYALEERPTTVNHGVLLRSVLGTGLTASLVPLFGRTDDLLGTVATVLRRGARPGRQEVEAYGEIARHQWQLYWTTEASLLFEAAVAHTQMGIRLVQSAREELRRDLMLSVTRSALLAGRLAFFDLRQAAIAERCLQLASRTVNETNDHALAVGVLAHASFVPGFAQNRGTAEVLLDGARAHLRHARGGPLLRSWVHSVGSEIATLGGDPVTGIERARQAADSLAKGGEDPYWLDFYNPARLLSFRGYAEMRAGRGVAVDTLQTALLGLEEHASRQRTIVLLDLAAACAREDAAHAVDLAAEAIRLLAEDPYATAMERFALLLERLPESPYQSELKTQLRDNAIPVF
jgi:transcriptional regulator with XRE-family HTH domain